VIGQYSPEEYPVEVRELKEFCLTCGHCVAVCPTGAFRLASMTPEDCRPLRKELDITPEQAAQFLARRRSIRSYKEDPLPREVIEDLLLVASRAASAKNEQPWRFIVVHDTGLVKRMAGMVAEWMKTMIPKFPDNPRVQGFVRVVKAWDKGMDLICRGAPHMIVCHASKDWPFNVQDCTLAMDSLDLYAQSRGLATCWSGYFTSAANDHPPLTQALGLPAENQACGSMMLGLPKFKYQRLPKRNDPVTTWL
jgi:nitroreductase